MDKRKMYIILIAVAAVILAGLLVLAICLNANKPADGTKDTKSNEQISAQATDGSTGETGSEPEDTTGDATTDPEDTTGATGETAESGADSKDTDKDTDKNTDKDADKDTDKDTDKDSDVDTEDDDSDEDGSGSSDNSTDTKPTEPPLPDVYPYTLTYKEYLDMSEDEQVAFYKLFPNHSEFKKWRTKAKEDYDNSKLVYEIGEDGKIDLSKPPKKKG